MLERSGYGCGMVLVCLPCGYGFGMVVVEVLVWLRHGVGMVWVRHGMVLARLWYGADIVVERFGVALVWFWCDFGMALAWLCGVWLRYCIHWVFV